MTRAEEWQLSEDQSSQHPTAEGLTATAEGLTATAEGPASTFDLGLTLAEQGDQAGASAAFQAAVDSGDAEQAPVAAVNLGVLLAGQGDLVGARAAFQTAIDSEHEEFAPIAELLMGEHCMTGDPQARLDHRLRAAAWANADVLLSLAELHLTERDHWTGRQMLVRAATAGMTEATAFLKLFPREDTDSADEQTLQNVSAAAEAGDTDSMNVRGVHASLQGDVDLAISWWTRSAAEGDVIAPLLISVAPPGDTAV